MSNRLIAGELDDGEYRVPPILPNFLLKKSIKPLVHAIREHKWYMSRAAGDHDVGWLAAKKDFIERGYRDLWEYGFKYGCLLKPSPNVNPELKSSGGCQDFKYYMDSQNEAAKRTMQEMINRSGRTLSEEHENELFNRYQAKTWAGGFREGFCGYTCLCQGCSVSLPLLLRSEPSVVKSKRLKQLTELFFA